LLDAAAPQLRRIITIWIAGLPAADRGELELLVTEAQIHLATELRCLPRTHRGRLAGLDQRHDVRVPVRLGRCTHGRVHTRTSGRDVGREARDGLGLTLCRV
jgi:hypothetical protein